MAPFWSAVGSAAALAWFAILAWSDRHPQRRLWPPRRGSLTTAAWAWGLTIAIYLGVLQAGFADPNGLSLPGWLRWGVGLGLTLLGSIPHTWGTIALGLKATSGWPAPLRTDGPYGSGRHPQYAGQIAMLVGLGLVGGTLWSLLPAIVGALALLFAAAVEERHLAATAEGHAAWKARTRFLL